MQPPPPPPPPPLGFCSCAAWAELSSTCSPQARHASPSFSTSTCLQSGCTQLRMQIDVELLLGRHLTCLVLHLGREEGGQQRTMEGEELE